MFAKTFRLISLALFLSLIFAGLSWAEVSTGQILRSEEILEKEKALRQRLQEEEKVFIRKIKIEGVTLLSESQIKEIISPFQKRWLTKTQIQQILELIKEAYRKNSYQNQPKGISYQIKGKELSIKAEEVKLNIN